MEENNHEEMNNEQVLRKLEQTNDKIKNMADEKINSFSEYNNDEGLRSRLIDKRNIRVQTKSQSDYRTESLNKRAPVTNLIYSPNKIRVNKKIHKTNEVPVGSAQKITRIKKKLGGDDQWKEFCKNVLKDTKTLL